MPLPRARVNLESARIGFEPYIGMIGIVSGGPDFVTDRALDPDFAAA